MGLLFNVNENSLDALRVCTGIDDLPLSLKAMNIFVYIRVQIRYINVGNTHVIYKQYTTFIFYLIFLFLVLLLIYFVNQSYTSCMPAKSDTIIYNMRFPKKDEKLYNAALDHAETKRLSLAELIRQLLIKDLTEAGKWPK